MVKKAKNIYDYYREQEVKDLDQERVQPLENNTTKALINTLENCSLELTQDLFEKVLDTSLKRKIHYFLQKTPESLAEILERKGIDIKNFRDIYILGISKYGESDVSQKDFSDLDFKGNSRPDAFIFGNETLIAVEAKTGDDELKKSQLKSHKKGCNEYLNERSKPLKVEYLEWNEIWKFLDDKEMNRKLDSFLVDQLVEYLKVNNMTKFTNFDRNLLESEGRSRALKKQVKNLTERLRKNLPDEYGLTHSRTTDNPQLSTWDYLCYENRDKNDNLPHITLSMKTDEFEIKIHVRGKIGKDEHITYLYENLPGRKLDSFLKYLKEEIFHSVSKDKIENQDKLPRWYKNETRPIWIELHGRRSGLGSFGGIKSKYRLKKELGIVKEDDFRRAEKFLQEIFNGTKDHTRHNFQVVLNYPYSDSDRPDSTDILTGNVGRDFYEEAYEAIEMLYPLFEDIKEKSL